MKKNLILLAVGISMAMSCQLNELDIQQVNGDIFYATIDNGDMTKTTLDNNAILWSAEDQISIFKKSTVNSRYEVTPSSVGESSGTFTKVHTDDDFHAGTELDHNVAAYPYLESLRIGKSATSPSYKVTGFSLPATQTYVKNSFASGAFPMVAVSENTELTFRNVCGGILLKLKGSQKITSIKIQGKNNEKLSGSATLRIYYDGTVPYIEMSSDASTSVTLDCGSGVQLNESKATEFIIVLPPLTFTKGFTVTVTDSNDEDHVIETSKSNEVKRSSLLAMPEMALNGIPSDTEPQEGDYIDEYGINHGPGIAIGNVVWAPVNCGYHETDYPYGKLYQWGRKYGQGYDGDATYPTVEDGTIKEGGVSLAEGQSQANKDVFFTNDYDWVYPSDDKLWNSGAEENPVKTEYDPCPEGWRVPTYNELKELQSNRSPWTENDKGQSGRWFSGASTYSDDVPQIFLPAAGYRSYNGNASVRGNHGCYWSSRPSGFFVYYLNFSSGNVGMSDTFGLVFGYSVRCIKEEPASPTPSEPEAINLSENGTANSYIVSEAGSYKFTPTKGNSNESVGTISSVEVLWETFGTDVAPTVGDLVKNVKYADGAISFDTPSTFKEGNAVIAAKDASGNILWSWHIWLTDEPQGQEYYNNAGTMMDRNLGATSATSGDVGALGLLYQWGRKDPFLGSSSISSRTIAKSTIAWPSAVSSDSSNGTIAYATANPTTFITYNESNNDWYYTGDSSTDNTRWTTSESSKSIYDPCPAGWRVPDGGNNGVWSTALGSSSSYNGTYDSTNKGMNFSGMFGSASTIWYPASGYRGNNDGSLNFVGSLGYCWSASPILNGACYLYLDSLGLVVPSVGHSRAYGSSVRCVQEYSPSGETVPVSDIQLSHTSLDLQEGETAQLIATVIPSDATDKNVVWNSDTPSVATVDQSGLVTAVSSGTAIITATAQDGGKTASCTVSVVNIDSLVSAKFRNISFGNGGSMEYEGYYIKVTAGLQMGISLNNNSKHEITVTGFRMICGLTNTTANYSINETEISGGKSLNITVTIPFTMYAPIAEFTYRYGGETYKARVQFNGSF